MLSYFIWFEIIGVNSYDFKKKRVKQYICIDLILKKKLTFSKKILVLDKTSLSLNLYFKLTDISQNITLFKTSIKI